VKLVSVVGVPKPLEAIFSIGEVERDEDKDYSFSRYSIPDDQAVRMLTNGAERTGNPGQKTKSAA
jgi:hypothetical protein